ncbi:MAG: diguanylate cyclase, partial [Dehalobacterium sp.]
MKLIEAKRNKDVNSYIMISQMLFFLLIGILLYKSANISFEGYFYQLPTICIFILSLALIPFLQMITLSSKFQIFWDLIISTIYIIIAVAFISKESEDLFKMVFLMPVIVLALKYGVVMGFISAFLSSLSLFFTNFFNSFISIDADIVFSSVFFLLAWLLGNMTETEHRIRTELERLATYDGLTDIYNHRSFQNILEQELGNAEKDKTSVCLILLDIDYFKSYNDAYGHQEGDKVLKQLAQLIKNIVGKAGYCARYGGEEFALILPKYDIIKGKEMGERVRAAIEGYAFSGENVFPNGKLTVSVGVAEYPLNADDKEKLIKKADEALYRAKFVSKNRVESYYSVFEEISVYLKEEEREMFNSISAFTMVINAKDRYTYGHSLRVMDMAKRLAVRMEVKADLIQEITFGALLHDIGKVEISREVLNKPSRLNQGEWDIFRQHPIWGADIISPLKSLH